MLLWPVNQYGRGSDAQDNVISYSCRRFMLIARWVPKVQKRQDIAVVMTFEVKTLSAMLIVLL